MSKKYGLRSRVAARKLESSQILRSIFQRGSVFGNHQGPKKTTISRISTKILSIMVWGEIWSGSQVCEKQSGSPEIILASR